MKIPREGRLIYAITIGQASLKVMMVDDKNPLQSLRITEGFEIPRAVKLSNQYYAYYRP